MSVAEEVAQRQRRDQFWGRIVGVVLAILVFGVLTLSVFLVRNIGDTREVTDQVDTALDAATLSICNTRVTTLRTAPQTVKEIRAVVDANSTAARKVCPDLDYDALDAQRAVEVAKLKAGADPTTVALTGADGKVGAAGKAGASGANGQNGQDGQDGARGDRGSVGATGAPGRSGANGARGPQGMPGLSIVGPRGPAGPAGPPGPPGATGPAGPAGPPGRNAPGIGVGISLG